MFTILSLAAGLLVGVLLGLFGGGGSILAVPLLIYLVGLTDVHLALGTGAVAVAATALSNLAVHARLGNVKWPCASAFAGSGIAGAFIGAELGQIVDGKKLMAAFSLAMVGVGISVLRRPTGAGDAEVHINPRIASRLIPTGFATGVASGFFGIGGGFLIVPGLMGAANMTMINAVGSSLVAVTAFASATAASYASAGLVDWRAAAGFAAGGLVGSFVARIVTQHLGMRQELLKRAFAVLIFCVAGYILLQALK